MNLTPLYLRADNEAAMIAALPDYMRGVDENGLGFWSVAAMKPRFDLCAIGPVIVTPAFIDAETGEIETPAVMDTRFHINVMVDADALADIPHEIILDPAPATPAVKFAGVE